MAGIYDQSLKNLTANKLYINKSKKLTASKFDTMDLIAICGERNWSFSNSQTVRFVGFLRALPLGGCFLAFV